MSNDPSSDDPFITGVDYPSAFAKLAITLCDSATRYICILSPRLDHQVFDNPALAYSLSILARRSRYTQIRILVSDGCDIIQRGHRLVHLARRIPSAIHVQKLTEHPDMKGDTLLIRDLDGILYKPAGSDHSAFYEPNSRSSTQPHLDLFNELWRLSSPDPEFRSLSL